MTTLGGVTVRRWILRWRFFCSRAVTSESNMNSIHHAIGPSIVSANLPFKRFKAVSANIQKYQYELPSKRRSRCSSRKTKAPSLRSHLLPKRHRRLGNRCRIPRFSLSTLGAIAPVHVGSSKLDAFLSSSRLSVRSSNHSGIIQVQRMLSTDCLPAIPRFHFR